eukprot:CAMPEP_0168554264 /NCGR_PEP_ID=MMETSP0413-20121227/7684_1 /TAXON_ID=136452 /ORGANISM="Filamoeba nolandi, Strain NC-AS-23-1" /LENGTH=943 /DNA_ID=CAMNT_0008584987 /DNA_START=182 /DNA_END=3013 /DNA_ORIENTATION=+
MSEEEEKDVVVNTLNLETSKSSRKTKTSAKKGRAKSKLSRSEGSNNNENEVGEPKETNEEEAASENSIPVPSAAKIKKLKRLPSNPRITFKSFSLPNINVAEIKQQAEQQKDSTNDTNNDKTAGEKKPKKGKKLKNSKDNNDKENSPPSSDEERDNPDLSVDEPSPPPPSNQNNPVQAKRDDFHARFHSLPKRLPSSVTDKNGSMRSMVAINEANKIFFQSILVLESKDLKKEEKEKEKEKEREKENLQLNVNTSLKDESGNSVLHMACLLAQLDLVLFLIRKGAKVNEPNNKGCTPLHYACSKGSMLHVRCAEICLMNGAKVNSKNHQNETPLHYAICYARHGNRGGNIALIHLLCRWRADTQVRDVFGRTPVHYASQFGQIQSLNLMLEKSKGVVNMKDEKDCTPLHLAIIHGNLECTRLLLLRGANLAAATEEGSTVFHLACKHRRPKIVDLLLTTVEKNPKTFHLIGDRDKHGFSCVHWAAIKGDFDSLKQFPEFLDVRDNIGLTPCMWAILNGNRACAAHLIAKDVDTSHPHFEEGKSNILYPMAQDLQVGVQSELFSDITITLEETEETFPGHKVMLYRCFRNFIKEGEDKIDIRLRNINTETFHHFCHYLYTGRIPSDDVAVRTLLEFANIYKFGVLRQICENALLSKGKHMRLSNLPQYLSTILDKELFVDCIALVENKVFRLHRFILYARCPYFRTLLSAKYGSKSSESVNNGTAPNSPHNNNGGLSVNIFDSTSQTSNTTTVIELHGIPKLVFHCVVDYLYSDTVRRVNSLEIEELKQLYDAAQKLSLPKLAEKVLYYLFQKVDDDNVTDVFLLTQNTDMVLLRKACVDYISSDYKKYKKIGTLEPLHLEEIKKRKKELKKEMTNEEKERKLAEKNWKKIQKSAKSGAFPPPPMAVPPTPQSFFTKKATALEPIPPQPTPAKPSLIRRNSMHW